MVKTFHIAKQAVYTIETITAASDRAFFC